MSKSAIDRRWQTEIEELAELATHCGGRLQFSERPDGLIVRLTCRSPIKLGDADPVVTEVEHEIRIIRPPHWPSSPLIAQHRAPRGFVHGNVLSSGSGMRSVLPAPIGLICYTGRWSPSVRLTGLVHALYDLAAYRAGHFTTDGRDCLDTDAVVWTNQMLAKDPGGFPTDIRPLVQPTEAEARAPLEESTA